MRSLPPRGTILWGLAAAIGLLLTCPALGAQSEIAGTYNCAALNVGGRSGRCTSPPLILYSDGSYQIWGEQGTYAVRGNRVVLSQSKKRGPGRLRRGREIVFQYTYRGQKHMVTFRRQVEDPPGLAVIRGFLASRRAKGRA